VTAAQPNPADLDEPIPDDDFERASATSRRLPWSDRSILLVSLVAVLLLSPIWLGPSIVQLTGGESKPSTPPAPSVTVTPAPTALDY
jgi:hypothetical protein